MAIEISALEGLTSFQKDIIGFTAYILLCIITLAVAITFFTPGG